MAGAAVLAVFAAGCSSHHYAAAPATVVSGGAPEAGRPDPHRFLASDAATKRVRLTMLAALGSSNGGFNFDDYGRGELIVTVPQSWRVTMRFENRGSRRTSCAVVTASA